MSYFNAIFLSFKLVRTLSLIVFIALGENVITDNYQFYVVRI